MNGPGADGLSDFDRAQEGSELPIERIQEKQDPTIDDQLRESPYDEKAIRKEIETNTREY